MAFSMSQLKLKNGKNTFSKDIEACFGYIKSAPLLTDNLRKGLHSYLEFIIHNRPRKYINVDHFNSITIDLLVKCCKKPYAMLDVEDIKMNEAEMIYQIKQAIMYGSCKSLYREENDIDRFRDIQFEGIKKQKKIEDKDDFFKGVDVI